MIEAPSILTRLTTWRRGPAIMGLVALALLHISAATHQFEHAAEHDLNVCEACAAYSQLEDAVPSAAPGTDILVAPDAADILPLAGLNVGSLATTYRPRAPPLS